MKDYLKIQKLWYDDCLYEVKIVCSSPIITASAKVYVCDSIIDALVQQIQLFLSGKITEGYWTNGERGNDSTTCASLRFLHKDRLGHILIEVYMELDDGGSYNTHNCCFYLNTETGLLEKFCKNLPKLKQKLRGVEVVLNNLE